MNTKSCCLSLKQSFTLDFKHFQPKNSSLNSELRVIGILPNVSGDASIFRRASSQRSACDVIQEPLSSLLLSLIYLFSPPSIDSTHLLPGLEVRVVLIPLLSAPSVSRGCLLFSFCSLPHFCPSPVPVVHKKFRNSSHRNTWIFFSNDELSTSQKSSTIFPSITFS